MAVDVGIQLYSVRNALANDPAATLDQLLELGFTHFEGANHQALTDDGVGFGISTKLLSASVTGRGASIVGSHINPLEVERLPQVLDFHRAIGNPRIGCDIEFYPYGDLDYVKRRADVFNEVGRLCAERDMEFYYHNHFQEFQRFGDRTVYELIMESTDPSLVKIELDTYWAYRGGTDPLDLFRTYRDRVILAHQKDFPKDHGQPLNLFDEVIPEGKSIDYEYFEKIVRPEDFAEIGAGSLPIQQIIDAVDQLPNFRYLLVEQDFAPGAEFDSVLISRDALRRYDNLNF